MSNLSVSFPKTGRGLPVLEFLFSIFLVLFFIAPTFQGQYREIAMLASLGYMVYCANKEPQHKRLIVTYLVLVFSLVMLYLLLTDSTSISQRVSNRAIKIFFAKSSQYILMFVPIFMLYRYMMHATLKQLKIILLIAIGASVMFVNTAISVAEHLHTFRSDVGGQIGFTGFIFIYAYTFLFIACLEMYMLGSVKAYRYVSLAAMFFIFYFLIKAQYALSIVTTFISCLYLYGKVSKGGNLFVYITIILIAILLPILIKFFVSVSDSPLLNERLMEIYNGITGEASTADSDMESRLDLYWKSIKAFLSSPILGNRSLDFNPHSTFLAVLADIGILGGIIVYKLFKGAFRFMKSILQEDYIYFMPLICQILLMGFTNPIHSAPSNFIMLWFVCPLLIYYTRHIA